MSEAGAIAEQFRNLIGIESEPVSKEVEKGAIRRYVQAIGDTDPIYVDEEAAGKSRYGGIVAPATFLLTIGRTRRPPRVDSSLGRGGVNAGNEFEFLQPLRPGDVITVTRKIADVKERTGKLGKMVIRITEETFVNQNGEKVGVGRQTNIIHGITDAKGSGDKDE